MSNDRHTPEVAPKMAGGRRETQPRDVDRRDIGVREHIDDRDPSLDDRDHPHLDEREHIDAREMAGRRQTGDDVREMDRHETADERPVPMFAGAEAAGYRTQWDAIQTGFVDEPRKAVQEADALVSLVIRRLSDVFGDERASLERQWGKGDEISTEDLRVALRRYRSFFERLLSL
jgi:hypothetical protein